ncbi:MAG: hypothetical protein ACOVLD_03235 [Bacteroidia bacterium]
MNLQFIHDNRGNTTGVFIPIEEWQTLKTKYADLQKEEAENVVELASWQKQIIDERLSDYYKNSTDLADFDKTIYDIEKGLCIINL